MDLSRGVNLLEICLAGKILTNQINSFFRWGGNRIKGNVESIIKLPGG